MKLNAKQLRNLKIHNALLTKRFPVYLIIDNVYDTYNIGNIGGLFRLADALAIEKIYICGDSETPPDHKIKKASIGTYKIVNWEYFATAAGAIENLKKHEKNIQIISIEQGQKTVPYQQYSYRLPLAFVVGNETTGVSDGALLSCDTVVEIPIWGINRSLNVIVSASIVMYHTYNFLGLSNKKKTLIKHKQ